MICLIDADVSHCILAEFSRYQNLNGSRKKMKLLNNFFFGCLILVSGILLSSSAILAQEDERARLEVSPDRMEHIIHKAEDITYQEGPESLPQGAEYVILEGNPAEEGAFTMRLKFPADYRIPPHTHPRTERVTVLSGTFNLGMGPEFNEENMESLSEGAFFSFPPKMEHYAMTADETVVQLTSNGPWEINYINPQDDPRQQ